MFWGLISLVETPPAETCALSNEFVSFIFKLNSLIFLVKILSSLPFIFFEGSFGFKPAFLTRPYPNLLFNKPIKICSRVFSYCNSSYFLIELLILQMR